MNNLLKVAVMLTAYDQMSRTIQDAVSKSKSQLTDLKNHATKSFAQGAGLLGASQSGFNAIGKTVSAYADLQDASLDLQSVLMKDGGNLDKGMLGKLDTLAEKLGDKLPGTTSDMDNLFAVMIQNGEKAGNIVNGVGASAANLAIAIKMPYDAAGKFAVKLKQATGTANEDMMNFMDTIARVNNLGVDASEMQYAFGRSAGSLKLLNLQGLEASKSLSSVFAMLIRNGKSGETVGTGMSAVFNSFLSPKKMQALNDATKQYGIHLDFVDQKTGKFKGVENMMIQFDKLRGLNSLQRAGIVQAFLGPGQDADFMNTLIAEGVEGFNKINKAMSEQATLSDKVNIKMGGLKNRWEATTGTFTNLLATLGKSLEPILVKIMDLVGNVLSSLKLWFQENPRFAKFIMLTATFVSTALAIAGVIKIIQGIIAVMKILNIVMALNPFLLIVGAAIVAAALVIAYWDKIVAFFRNLWARIKALFVAAWNGIKKIISYFDPRFLIFGPWGAVALFFYKNFDTIKAIVRSFLDFIKGIAPNFYNAGANIAKQIYNGVKAFINKPVEAIASMTKKMREYLPFSPAKAGAFRDLHKVKIVETIADAIKPAPAVKKMAMVTSALSSQGGVAGSSGGNGSIVVNYSPVIHFGGGSSESDKKSFLDMLKQSERELVRLIDEAIRKRDRSKF